MMENATQPRPRRRWRRRSLTSPSPSVRLHTTTKILHCFTSVLWLFCDCSGSAFDKQSSKTAWRTWRRCRLSTLRHSSCWTRNSRLNISRLPTRRRSVRCRSHLVFEFSFETSCRDHGELPLKIIFLCVENGDCSAGTFETEEQQQQSQEEQ